MPIALPVIAILAHPGHELLVLQSLGDWQAHVIALTDGSGGVMADRTAWSRKILHQRGCGVDSLFGHAPDREFYAAILRCDAGFFAPLVTRLRAAIEDTGALTVITDPIEYFNPVHDLTNVMTDLAVRGAAKPGRRVTKLTYPIEYADKFDRSEAVCVRSLTPEETQRKIEDGSAYLPLRHEVERLLAAGKLACLDEELFFPDSVRGSDVPPPQATRFGEAYYETYGRRMVAEGRYDRVLTFREHFLPLVTTLAGAASLMP